MPVTKYKICEISAHEYGTLRPVAINNLGQVLCYGDGKSSDDRKLNDRYAALLWSKEGSTFLGNFRPVDLNNHGTIVGIEEPTRKQSYRARICEAGLPRLFCPKDASMTTCKAVNDAGYIAGNCYYPSDKVRVKGYVGKGEEHWFIPTPEGWYCGDVAGLNEGGELGVTLQKVADRTGAKRAARYRMGMTEFVPLIDNFEESKSIAIASNGDMLCRATLWDRRLIEQMSEPSSPASYEKAHGSEFAYRQEYYLALARGGTVRMDFRSVAPNGGMAHAMNDLSMVVGTTGFGGPHRAQALLWSEGKAHNLIDLVDDSNGWHLHVARGINNIGAIIGSGEYDNKPTAFLLDTIAG